MSWPRPLEVAFLTNFSDSCFRAIPFLAQLVDDLAVNLTIIHTYDPDRERCRDAEASLRSFFPEADRYPNAFRLALAGDPLSALKQFSLGRTVDLVICPASDPLGLPRLGHRSLRGRIIHECGIPVWTIGRRVEPAKLGRPVKNVACWIDFDSASLGHLHLAKEYAEKLGAQLHLLCNIPDFHEGMLARFDPDRPLHPAKMKQALQEFTRGLGFKPEVHVGSGSAASVRTQLSKACDADILFTRVARPLLFSTSFFDIDRCACPSICLSEDSIIRTWNLIPGPALTAFANEAA